MPEWNGSYYVAPVSVPERDPDPPDYDDEGYYYEHEDSCGCDDRTPADHELDKQKALREDGVYHDGTPRERVKKGE